MDYYPILSRRPLPFNLVKISMATLTIILFTWLPIFTPTTAADTTYKSLNSKALTNTPPASLIIAELHLSRLLLQKIIMNYHLFSVKGSDPMYDQAIQTHIKSFDLLTISFPITLTDESHTATLESLSNNWKSFNQQLASNRKQVRKKGSANIQTTDDMMASAELLRIDLVDITTEVAIANHHRVKGSIAKARELTLIIQQLATDYAGRSSSSFGVSHKAQGIDKPIDVLAKEFSSKLDTLALHKGNNTEIKTLFRKIQTKWRFIEKPLENYTESSIPFLITRYSEHIISSLQKIASLYQ